VAPVKLAELARFGMTAKAFRIGQLKDARKAATLLATVRHLEAFRVINWDESAPGNSSHLAPSLPGRPRRCPTIGCMQWHGPDGHRLYYEDTGRGDTVVVMAGWAGSIIELGQLRAALVPGFRVIAVDLPGSGRSQPQPRRYDAGYYHHDARVVLGLLDALGVSVAHLAGFSDGGEVAVLVAALRPGVALSLFTWGTAGRLTAWLASHLCAAGRSRC
jgi:hypothetical protein